MMEEHKKMEEKKKIEEEEKSKKELELAEKNKEEAIKNPEKKVEVMNINSIESNSVNIENQLAVAIKENKIENSNEKLGKIKDTNAFKKAKINLMNNNNEAELKINNNFGNINSYIDNNNLNNPSSDKINNNNNKSNQANLKQESLKPSENQPTERKMKEKIELNNLLKNLNYVEEDIVNEQTEMNFEIPYHLTREWVVKNLLS